MDDPATEISASERAAAAPGASAAAAAAAAPGSAVVSVGAKESALPGRTQPKQRGSVERIRPVYHEVNNARTVLKEGLYGTRAMQTMVTNFASKLLVPVFGLLAPIQAIVDSDSSNATLLAVAAYVVYVMGVMVLVGFFMYGMQVRHRVFMHLLRYHIVMDVTNFRFWRNPAMYILVIFAITFAVAGLLSDLTWGEYLTSLTGISTFYFAISDAVSFESTLFSLPRLAEIIGVQSLRKLSFVPEALFFKYVREVKRPQFVHALDASGDSAASAICGSVFDSFFYVLSKMICRRRWCSCCAGCAYRPWKPAGLQFNYTEFVRFVNSEDAAGADADHDYSMCPQIEDVPYGGFFPLPDDPVHFDEPGLTSTLNPLGDRCSRSSGGASSVSSVLHPLSPTAEATPSSPGTPAVEWRRGSSAREGGIKGVLDRLRRNSIGESLSPEQRTSRRELSPEDIAEEARLRDMCPTDYSLELPPACPDAPFAYAVTEDVEGFVPQAKEVLDLAMKILMPALGLIAVILLIRDSAPDGWAWMSAAAFVIYAACILVSVSAFFQSVRLRERIFRHMLRWNIVLDLANKDGLGFAGVQLGRFFLVVMIIAGFRSSLTWTAYLTMLSNSMLFMKLSQEFSGVEETMISVGKYFEIIANPDTGTVHDTVEKLNVVNEQVLFEYVVVKKAPGMEDIRARTYWNNFAVLFGRWMIPRIQKAYAAEGNMKVLNILVTIPLCVCILLCVCFVAAALLIVIAFFSAAVRIGGCGSLDLFVNQLITCWSLIRDEDYDDEEHNLGFKYEEFAAFYNNASQIYRLKMNRADRSEAKYCTVFGVTLCDFSETNTPSSDAIPMPKFFKAPSPPPKPASSSWCPMPWV